MVENIRNKQRYGWCFKARIQYLRADLLFVETNVTDPNLMGKMYGKEYAP